MNIYMSEESFHSLSSTPPTPGKHLFIPPPPILASSFSSISNSSNSSSSFTHSQGKQELGNLPLKKRRDVALSSQVRERLFVFDLYFSKKFVYLSSLHSICICVNKTRRRQKQYCTVFISHVISVLLLYSQPVSLQTHTHTHNNYKYVYVTSVFR